MTGPRIPNPDLPAMTKEAFLSWMAKLTPEEQQSATRILKPRVRVPVKRQTPNEADL